MFRSAVEMSPVQQATETQFDRALHALQQSTESLNEQCSAHCDLRWAAHHRPVSIYITMTQSTRTLLMGGREA